MSKKITTKRNPLKQLSIISVATASLAFVNTASATIVEFQTSQGNFQVNLFDQSTPKTVTNFLSYVNSGHYTNTVVHRAVPGFIVQAGGFEFGGKWPLTRLSPNPAITNEPVYSNVTGTIAMAKLGNDENSATDQWFFNLADNSSNLDFQNGGFTVFGQVIDDPNDPDDGMAVVNKIAQLDLCNANLEGIPMVIDEGLSCRDMGNPGLENFAVIEAITIIDSSEVTDSDLSPKLTTKGNSGGNEDDNLISDSGGTSTIFSLISLSLLALRRRLFTRY